MNAPTEALPSENPRKWLSLFGAARFFTFSLFAHIIILVLVGGIILYKAIPETPDFNAGNEGLMDDGNNAPGPPEKPDQAQINPSMLEPPAPSVEAIVTTASAVSIAAANFTVQSKDISSSLGSSVAAMAKRAEGGGGGMAGKIGGTMKMGMIFGRKIQAAKLGVILDVSGSAHPHLAGAITEIEKAFPDALLILYPGCGMVSAEGKEGKGKKEHTIRKLSTITQDELQATAGGRTTSSQLLKAMKIDAFEKLVHRPAMKERLFVSWYEGKDDGKASDTLTRHADVSFRDLLTKGVDTIYWFADFRDKVEPQATEDLLKDLQKKKIRVYLQNFAGLPIPPQAAMLAEKTGGTASTEKPEPKL